MKRLETLYSNYLYALKNMIYGRKRELRNSVSDHKKNGFILYENELNRLYQRVKRQFTEIRLHTLYSTRIGEYIPRYLLAVQDSIQHKEKGILDVFVLTDCINHNARLSKIMGRNIQIIDETNAHIWEYILCHFPKVEFVEYLHEYSERNQNRLLNPEQTARFFSLTEDEEKEGQYKKSLMGLHKPFVCVASRDNAYLHKVEPNGNWRYHDYRDSDINRLNLSAEYLSEKGVTMVRMGRHVKEKVDFCNCIDYANQYYDELMDFVLMKDCKFFLGDSNGICVLPMSLNKPTALKNVVPVFLDAWGAQPQNPKNLFIFKKYYKIDEERFLSIKEMMEIEKNVRYNGLAYKRLGIEVVENTAEEILDLTMEMNARIDGEWIETPEDIELQKKYQTIFEEWIKREHLNKNAMLYAKVGAMFLKKNRFLLEG